MNNIVKPKETGLKRARTVEEYIDLVKNALFEVEDLRAAIEYDNEGMHDAPVFLEKLENAVRGVYDDMVAGTYAFGREDLAFMSIVRDAEEGALPFKYLLVRINETHKHGLEVEEEN